MIPVVPGEVVFDGSQGAVIISTEAFFSFLTPILRPTRIVLVGERAIFTADPRRDPDARRIPVIDDGNVDEVLQRAGGSHGLDVTGGMASKVRAMWRLVRSYERLEVQLVAPDPALLVAVLQGVPVDDGTIIRRRSVA